VDFLPVLLRELVNVYVVLLLGDVLDASEHEDVNTKNKHGVASPW